MVLLLVSENKLRLFVSESSFATLEYGLLLVSENELRLFVSESNFDTCMLVSVNKHKLCLKKIALLISFVIIWRVILRHAL